MQTNNSNIYLKYTIKDLTDSFLTNKLRPDIAELDWQTLELSAGYGSFYFRAKDLEVEHKSVYLLHFSASLIFCLRAMIFYGSSEEIVRVEESSGFFRCCRTNNLVTLQFFESENEPFGKAVNVDVQELARAAGKAHMDLINYFFQSLPSIKRNKSFMNGFPDAMLIKGLKIPR